MKTNKCQPSYYSGTLSLLKYLKTLWPSTLPLCCIIIKTYLLCDENFYWQLFPFTYRLFYFWFMWFVTRNNFLSVPFTLSTSKIILELEFENLSIHRFPMQNAIQLRYCSDEYCWRELKWWICLFGKVFFQFLLELDYDLSMQCTMGEQALKTQN